MIAEVILPFFAFYCFRTSVQPGELPVRDCLADPDSMTSLPRIEFIGVPDSHVMHLLGEATWWMGAISVPLFLFPVVYRFYTKGRAILDDVTQKPDRLRSARDKLQHRALLVALIVCSLYYVIRGYFVSAPIELHSAAGTTAMTIGISFGPAAIVLLSAALAIDLMASTPVPEQGTSHE